MNSKNSNSFDPHSLVFYLADKINLKKTGKYAALSNFSICYTWKNIKKSYKNNKSKISAPTCNDKSELVDVSYSVLDIKDYFEYIIKKHDNLPIIIFANKIENRITFKIKIEYQLEFLTPDTMKLLGKTEKR